jgi:hypothetical protein
MVSLVTELLFSYGTLRPPGVQHDVFGRELDGWPDAIVGYDLDYVTITDPRVIASSGSDRRERRRTDGSRRLRGRRLQADCDPAAVRRSRSGIRVRRTYH